MFSQIALVIIRLFLVVNGIRNGDYMSISLGVLVSDFAASTLYKLKTGK